MKNNRKSVLPIDNDVLPIRESNRQQATFPFSNPLIYQLIYRRQSSLQTC